MSYRIVRIYAALLALVSLTGCAHFQAWGHCVSSEVDAQSTAIDVARAFAQVDYGAAIAILMQNYLPAAVDCAIDKFIAAESAKAKLTVTEAGALANAKAYRASHK